MRDQGISIEAGFGMEMYPTAPVARSVALR